MLQPENLLYPDAHTHYYTGLPLSVYCAETDVQPPTGLFSLAYHPWKPFPHVDEEHFRIFLTRYAANPDFVAIGECGLDYVKGYYDKAKQKEIFKINLQAAHSVSKPVIVHCVRAYQDLWPLIAKAEIPVLLHAFLPSPANVRQVLSLPQVYVSFGLRESRHPSFKDALKTLPPARILPESDEGKNGTKEICRLMSSALNIHSGQWRAQMEDNFRKLYPVKVK